MSNKELGYPVLILFDSYSKAKEAFSKDVEHSLLESQYSLNEMWRIDHWLGKNRKVYYGYCKTREDSYRYRGYEFRLIKFDENSFFSGEIIPYMLSRIRYSKDD